MNRVAAREALREAAARLRGRGVEQAHAEAERLLCTALGVDRLELYLHGDRVLSAAQTARFDGFVRRRLSGEPLQYILGVAHFRELALRVDRRVLIPRPETEVLVECVLRWAAGREGPAAVDVGTGSGAIALSLARETRFSQILATDSSRDALELAAENAALHGLEDRVEFRLGPLWQPLAGERFDVVVSNPPYVAEADADGLPREVRDWEPARALFAGGGGLDTLAALVAGAAGHLRPGGLLALEVGLGQARAVARRIRAAGGFGPARIIEDLTGRERVVLAVLDPLAKTGEKSDHARDGTREGT